MLWRHTVEAGDVEVLKKKKERRKEIQPLPSKSLYSKRISCAKTVEDIYMFVCLFFSHGFNSGLNESINGFVIETRAHQLLYVALVEYQFGLNGT